MWETIIMWAAILLLPWLGQWLKNLKWMTKEMMPRIMPIIAVIIWGGIQQAIPGGDTFVTVIDESLKIGLASCGAYSAVHKMMFEAKKQGFKFLDILKIIKRNG